MTSIVEKYKIKHVVSLKPSLIENITLPCNIEGKDYNFSVETVGNEIIEFRQFFKYREIKFAGGPLERKLKDYTYGKDFNNLSEHEKYEIRFSKFKAEINGDTHELEITGVGPSALKVSLFISYKDIENAQTNIEKGLKKFIIDEYEDLIENNVSYQKKLDELKKNYDDEEAKREKIREEVRLEQEEKERKRRELEEMLNANKPKNNERPFKMY